MINHILLPIKRFEELVGSTEDSLGYSTSDIVKRLSVKHKTVLRSAYDFLMSDPDMIDQQLSK